MTDDPSITLSQAAFHRVLFLICPTGSYCREDRCQSYFSAELIPSKRPPLEECQGAAGVVRAGGVAAVIDAPSEGLSREPFLGRIRSFDPQLIVLGVTFGSLEQDLQWASDLRALLPSAKIALRGAPCYVWGEELLLQNPAIDLCTRGDYELVFEGLVQQGLSAAGVLRRGESGEILDTGVPQAQQLDELPIQDRSSINQQLYTVRGTRFPQATIHVQRGCSFPCSFCLVHTVSGNRARHRSPESIVAEVRSSIDDGITHFYLRAETFSLDRRWAIAVSNALAKSCPEARWVTATRVECVDDEVIAVMRRGGCYGISFGVDVASEEIGRRVRKPPNLSRATEAMRLCDTHGVVSLAYIMIGFLWDSADTVAEAARFIRAIRPDLLTVHFAHPYPGTPYYEAVRSSGAPVLSLQAQATPAIDLPGLTRTQLSSAARQLLVRHYLRSSVIFSLARKSVARLLDGGIHKSIKQWIKQWLKQPSGSPRPHIQRSVG